MELIQSKSLLAKLMATENLIVEQRNVSTASFNVKDRVLTLPILDKDISAELYDLLVGHEVGHALWTDEELLLRGIDLKIARSVMNVIEDVRIERKIKNKYPGIRSSFIKGYRELIAKDFFGTAGLDLNDLNFIDRVNLYSKGGANVGIKFIEVERDLLKEIESTETPDDVIVVAKKVMEYLKEEKEEKKKQNPKQENEESDDELEESNSDYDDESDYGDEDEDGDQNQSSSNSEFGEEEGDETETDNLGSQADTGDKEESEQQESTGSEAGRTDEELKSHTDENFRQNENKLYVDDKRIYYYGNVPNIPTKDVVVSHKVLWNRYREFFTDLEKNRYYHGNCDHSSALRNFQKLRTEANKVVSYLAKEFELRKNADQLKRTSTAKTGDLNMNKIFSYKFSEDIFKKVTVTPGGKSHGLVMFIDWSGSMSDHLQNTMKQLINLVMFCKKVNIPYDVYAFTDNYDDNFNIERKEGDIAVGDFKLLNILSSKMSASDFSYAAAALVNFSSERRNIVWPSWFCLGGTPLNETVMAAMNVVPEFQKAYKLQIVNTVFLTDGEGANNYCIWTNNGTSDGILHEGFGDTSTSSSYRWTRYLTIRDPITKNQQVAGTDSNRHLTSHFIKLLKARTNCNIVGFYVLSGRELGRNLHSFFGTAADSSKLKATFRKEKSLTVTSSGFDEYYLLRSEGLDTEEETELEVKENATTRGLVSAFTKFSGGRQSSRVVLNRFINMIA
jgi:hypothetical protein